MLSEIIYELRPSRTRRMRIYIYPDGKVVVTKPARVSVAEADKLVRSKAAWIEQKIIFQKNRKLIPLGTVKIDQAAALAFVKSRIGHFNQHYNFTFRNVSVKNLKSQWGSCSARKNLNFNQKILLLPPKQADYVIVHELCHLQEMNHSRKFWARVAETIPDFKEIRKELRSYSLQ